VNLLFCEARLHGIVRLGTKKKERRKEGIVTLLFSLRASP